MLPLPDRLGAAGAGAGEEPELRRDWGSPRAPGPMELRPASLKLAVEEAGETGLKESGVCVISIPPMMRWHPLPEPCEQMEDDLEGVLRLILATEGGVGNKVFQRDESNTRSLQEGWWTGKERTNLNANTRSARGTAEGF